MARTVDEAIAAAIGRGALTEAGAARWRAAAQPGAVRWLDALSGDPVLAASRPQSGAFATAAAAPPGADPLLFAQNPLHQEMRKTHPALVAAAERENGPPPKLFGDRHLPCSTASGLPPEKLAAEPWPIRRAMAAAPTLQDAYALHDKYASAPELAHADHAHAPLNQPYLSDFSQWLQGQPGGPRPPTGGNARPAQGLGASAPVSDYSTEQLHAELFGASGYAEPRPAVPETIPLTEPT